MPPKQQPSKKTVEKDKKKKVEDKTFGLKNKNKSKKVAAYVQSVENQVKNSGLQNKEAALRERAKKDKELAEKAKKEAESILVNTIVQSKVPLGVDPKSVVCEYFKQGVTCPKGSRCKLAHDLTAERKSAKIDLYTDRRKEEEDTMDKWDEAKLKSVVEKKRTTDNKNRPTSIICKFFLDAIENKKYGWFWECPNGEKCMYAHCLPEGYQLKKKKNADEEKEEIPIEELIEEERAKLTKHTPVTLETFLKWKEEKRLQKEKAAKEANDKRLADIKAGKTQMSGREMFEFNSELFVDDESAINVKSKEYEKTEEEIQALANQINTSLFTEEDLPDDDDDDDEDDGEEDDDHEEEEGGDQPNYEEEEDSDE